MGIYTEIFVNVDLKKETPEDVLDCLAAMCGQHEPSLSMPKDSPVLWEELFSANSCYHPWTSVNKLTWDDVIGQWSLLGKGTIKNYDGEIQDFFEWLTPWIDGKPGDFVGYHRRQDEQQPTLVSLP